MIRKKKIAWIINETHSHLHFSLIFMLDFGPVVVPEIHGYWGIREVETVFAGTFIGTPPKSKSRNWYTLLEMKKYTLLGVKNRKIPSFSFFYNKSPQPP